jgi:presqualene diphosphate synthase
VNSPAIASGAEQPTAARRASGSSFYAAMRILPRARREAIYEVYGFCRAVDDVADDGGPRAERLAGLAQWRADIDALYAGAAPPHLSGLVEPMRAFGLRREDFLAVIDGMEMDVVGDIRAPDLATLDLYCDRVASAVGRLCVCIFGIAGEDGIALAHHLGRALQLTNILRDVDEDAAMGRLYLPREALTQAGITTSEPQAALASPKLAVACAQVMDRVREHFQAADAIMARQPRAAVRAPAIMGAAYKLIFARLAARGWSPPRAPIRLSKLQLAWVILRHVVL